MKVFRKKIILEILVKFTKKYLCHNLIILILVTINTLWHWRFPVNFVKFFRNFYRVYAKDCFYTRSFMACSTICKT